MKKIIFILFIFSGLYAQCDEYNESQCSNDDNCEWVQEEYGNCEDIINLTDCGEIEECSWWSGCYGGTYLINSSYCQESEEESEVLQCSEMEEIECGTNGNCNWIVDIQYGSCSNLGSSSCDATSGCWGAYQYPGWYSGWYCAGGTYIISDNSYCENSEPTTCSDIDTELECNHPLDSFDCQWVEDSETEIVECSEFDNSENGCNNYPGECSWEEEITYGSCSSYAQGTCNNVQGCYWDCSSWYTWVCWCLGSEIITDNVCEGEYEIITGSCMEAYDLGDVNSDGTINVIDIVELVSIILNAEYIISGDFNQDGVNNIVDIISLVNIVLGVN